MKNLFFLAFCLLANLVFAQNDQSISLQLDRYLTNEAAYARFNGNVLVAEKGVVVFQKSYGYADFDTKRMLNDSSVFELASVSKQFTATAILLLKDRGKLKLADSLRQYFPELPYSGITIYQMLTHTSGLPDYESAMNEKWDHGKIAFNKDMIDFLAKEKLPVLFKPGAKWEYSNTAYVLLASIVEKVSGQTFSAFLTQNIFQPLNMKHTRIYNTRRSTKEIIPNYAYGFVYSDSLKTHLLPDDVPDLKFVIYLDGIQGDGVVNSTTADLLKWDRAVKNHTLLNENTQKEMLKEQVLVDTATRLSHYRFGVFHYGFGVFMEQSALGYVISHSGGWPGYITYLGRNVDKDLTFIVLSNNGANAPKIAKELQRIVNGKFAPQATTLASVQQNDIVIGKIDTIQSRILGEQRKIWVHVPDGPIQQYPVAYVLDGDGHFSSVVGMIQSLSTGGNNNCPKMIVVGITNTDRTRDLTPTHVDADLPMLDSASAKTSGGGENFIAFIEKELMPYIEAKHSAAPYKMFIGHSFGGLAVMQAFVHHTELFDSYICIDPSMWWDNQKLLKQAQQALAERKFTGKSLYLGIANTMEDGMDIKKVRKDNAAETKHIRSILALQAAFEKNKQNGLKYRGKYYPDDTHGSVPLITEYDALRFFFDFFPMKFTMKDYTDSTGALADKYRKHFANLSQKMGYTLKPDEMEINYIGYDFLGRKLYKSAGSLFKLNVDNYPYNFNVYDAYADYLIATGDKANAIIQLKKALSITENEVSRKKLNFLEGKTQWSIIGTVTPNNWDADLPMTYDEANKAWKITLNLKAGEFKFRATGDWFINLGDTKGDGVLKSDGDNLKLAADGNYTVTLMLNAAGIYIYTLAKN